MSYRHNSNGSGGHPPLGVAIAECRRFIAKMREKGHHGWANYWEAVLWAAEGRGDHIRDTVRTDEEDSGKRGMG